ncbi:FAD/NAD(P)-binding domain-containing protein [Hypoxylon trugodes]|uniref:FAD/NAD(P)-binding domain-containing protein n=1 Tax=Hypoxylon trugodes TaxID=326681 RepID=UPI00219D4E25|nr:FAD/NAD(P)-binding domain-containing protein [Hypoxylon trugodes]KAI1390924.1 FAD/NAD(P)-binding domain-containing protein [Hypoxylon trugodes]
MAQNSNQAELPVLIIGAGCSGLALANGLKQKGIPFKLFERDAVLSPRNGRDWGLACHWSVPLLRSLLGEAKWSRISETLADPHHPIQNVERFPLYNGATGEILVATPIENLLRFLRSRLRAFAAEDLVAGVDIIYGKVFEGVEYAADGKSVAVQFSDGTTETGRLVVGADGSQSRLRNILLGPERAANKKLPLAATFVTASYPRDVAVRLRACSLNPIINAFPHPENMMGLFSLLDGADKEHPENWEFAYYISVPISVEEQEKERGLVSKADRVRAAKKNSLKFQDPLRTAYELIPDDLDKVYYTPNANWDPSLPEHEWDNHGGLVTLVGDAAHPMTYHRGQGLNHSLADVFNLVKALSNPEGKSQAELITEFEKEMRTRGGEEVRNSEMNSLMVHNWEKLEQSPLMKRGVNFGSDDTAKERATWMPKNYKNVESEAGLVK